MFFSHHRRQSGKLSWPWHIPKTFANAQGREFGFLWPWLQGLQFIYLVAMFGSFPECANGCSMATLKWILAKRVHKSFWKEVPKAVDLSKNGSIILSMFITTVLSNTITWGKRPKTWDLWPLNLGLKRRNINWPLTWTFHLPDISILRFETWK